MLRRKRAAGGQPRGGQHCGSSQQLGPNPGPGRAVAARAGGKAGEAITTERFWEGSPWSQQKEHSGPGSDEVTAREDRLTVACWWAGGGSGPTRGCVLGKGQGSKDC